MTEREAIALTCWGEARGESTAGRLAVASVLTNRLKTGRWGDTYVDVCLARRQFSCWNGGDPNLVALKAWLVKLESGSAIRNAVLRECLWIADGVLTEALRPQVGAATHYHSTSMATPPAWTKGATLVASIGRHRFYAHVA